MVDWNRLDYSTAPEGYRALRTSLAKFTIPGMEYFRLSGSDRATWLQGQCTNDVLHSGRTSPVDFCLTNPKGQIEAVGRAWDEPDWGLVIATTSSDVLRRRVEDTVFLESVELLIDVPRTCLQGPSIENLSGAYVSDRTGSGGYETEWKDTPVVETLSPEGYALVTLEAGIPLSGIDYTDKILPPELGPHFESQHVSYTKGCYVGQEVLMRIKARGHTNKTWVGLRSDRPITTNAAVLFGGKEVGVVHRSAHSPAFGHIASATLRNEATQEGTVVEVEGTNATVVQMPFLRD